MVHSEEGVGSTFEFTAVFKFVENEIDMHYEYGQLDQIRILVVDDNKTNRYIIKCYLEEFGAKVIEASSGEEVLGILLMKKNDKDSIEMVISDYQMPSMNGKELISASKSIASLKTLSLFC